MRHYRIIDRVVEALGSNDRAAKLKWNSDEDNSLVKYEGGLRVYG